MVVGGSALFIILGVAVLFEAVTTYRRSQYILDLPTSCIQSAATGLVEITGEVVPAKETITSPFAEQECVLCQYKYGLVAAEKEDETKGGSGLVGVPFYVEDGTGRMLVRPNGADIRIPLHLMDFIQTDWAAHEEHVTSERGLAEEPRESWRKRYELTDRLKPLRALGQATESGADPGAIPEGPPLEFEYAEARVEPGDTVYVLGTAQSEDSANEEAPDLVIAQSTQARRAASPVGSFLEDLLNTENLFRESGQYQGIFLISTEGEESFAESLRSQMWKELLGGPVIVAMGLLGLVLWFGRPGKHEVMLVGLLILVFVLGPLLSFAFPRPS